MIGTRFAAMLGLGVALAMGQPALAAPVKIKIDDGWLRGVGAGGVASFKDIPFAAPPVGNLRWRAPQPPTPWRGVRDAGRFGPACLQTSNGRRRHRAIRESEDCLTLNVFAPAHATARLPVMVWIHGGALVGGSASNYDGSRFARDGVVLVTVNYRLGRLGFFAHPALAHTNPEGALSDYGFADQIAALKWVRKNIAAFGGDPARVTIFGESAGGTSVNYLMTSPKARGLFVGAIAESSFPRQQGHSLADAEATGVAFMQHLGITGDDAAAAKAMRALPATALTAPMNGLGDNARGPIIDGVIASESPDQGFAKGDEARVPYIVGGNSFEASLLPGYVARARATLRGAGARGHRAAMLYGGGDVSKAAAAIITMAGVIEPDRYVARLHASRGLPTYTYYFGYVPKSRRATSMGAGHGAEVRYVFDTLHRNATAADAAMARSLHAYWVSFAKTGDPDSAGGPAWPKAEPDDRVMVFDASGTHAVANFDKAQFDRVVGLAARINRRK